MNGTIHGTTRDAERVVTASGWPPFRSMPAREFVS
jgi:hypothetical protein